ncbi:proline-rich nuclear receptor coactivator 1-like [Solea solea]|uniref:proline-rich nuclear receptor coactivator 1-like n=1 Tax=Solea solea TaxID=90069 RepID=UPI00272B03DF|nr:proline-rich nuclear receptor coactivator 1-like [Solea solea]
MLDGSLTPGDETNIGNAENNNNNHLMVKLLCGGDAFLTGNKARQPMLLKKGGKKLRTTTAATTQQLNHQHQKHARITPIIRLFDHNNNTTGLTSNKAASQSGTEPAAVTQTVLSLHPLKQGARKDVLKSKGGRLDRGPGQTGGHTIHNLPRHDHLASQNVNNHGHKPKTASQTPGAPRAKKRHDHHHSSPNKTCSPHQPPSQEQKRPLHASNNVKTVSAPPPAETTTEYLKDGEKVYAGAKFSEPPSPSVLPKPPSHWVGENRPHHGHQSREQMAVQLKSLLKVQDVP